MCSRQHSSSQALGSSPSLQRWPSLMMAQDLICEPRSKGFPPTGSNKGKNRAKLWASLVQAAMQRELHVVSECVTHSNLPRSFSFQSQISCPNLIHNVGFVLLNSFSLWMLHSDGQIDSCMKGQTLLSELPEFPLVWNGSSWCAQEQWWRIRHRYKAQRADCFSLLPSASGWKWERYLLLLAPQHF